MSMRAFITGQDGSYLAELLLNKGYEVHGPIRRSSSFNTQRLDHLYNDPHEAGARLFLHYGDLTDGFGLRRVRSEVQPDDYVSATGTSHSVRKLLELAFDLVGLDWHEHVEADSRYRRPAEVDLLDGDASKARRVLGWEPKVSFEQLVRMMADADWAPARQERLLAEHGSTPRRPGTA